MSRVRGKKRMEIIKNFLEGKDDPKYEVIPTVTEGKYFVRPRKDKKDCSEGEEQSEGEEEEIQEKQKLKHEQKLKQKQKPEQKQKLESKPETSFQQIYDPTISYQILEQLRLLGEEQRLKREKKEQKKLVKYQIRKQLKSREKEETSDEYDYEIDEEQPKKQVFQPTVLRRKINLNK